MAVYTHLSDADLNALLADYDLGEATGFHGIAEGVENSNFALTTTRGRYILTVFEKRVAEADLPFFVGVMARLAERGFPAPEPVATKAGAHLTRVKDKPAAIVSFLDGVWPRSPNLGHCAVIGEALARMHKALDGFAMMRANALGPDAWGPLINPHLALADELRPGLAAAIASDLAATRAAWPSDLPRGAIHADLFPDNAMFVGPRLSGVIDFYFACTDFLAYDLAVCLNAWCFEREREYNFTKGQAMIAAYEKVRPLTAAERDALPLLARGAALRFFATRLADWSATPAGALVRPKDPLEYADKLAFHRSARSAADYGA
jgi:homoserine kinase type II